MPLFRALAKNMAPMTNADESPTNRLTFFLTEHFSLYSIYSVVICDVFSVLTAFKPSCKL